MRFTQVLCGTASAVVLAGLTPLAAHAQTQDTETLTVDSIVVTAQKREQNLQDVPVVVTAVSAKLLQDTGVRDIKDLTILTPGLTVTSTSSEASTTARIRGVGTVGDNPGLESSVGVVIDGVYRPRNGVSFGDLGEMERIEVLKGPQGTLFGKNTSAGVINIVTKEPEFGFGANAEATLGNYNAHGLAASVTGPLFGTETLAARLYVAARERDGYNDVVTGKGPSKRDQDADQGFYTVRGQLLFVPDDKSSFKLIGDYTKRDENCCGAVQIRTGPTSAIINALAGGKGVGALTDNPYDRVAYSNRGAPSSIEDKGVSLEGKIETPFGELTSISAIRQWRTDNGQDSDFTTADIAYRNKDGTNYSEFTTYTQEVRLAGQTEKLDWLVGAFLADERLVTKANFLYGNDYEQYLGRLLSASVAPGGVPNFIALLLGRAPNTSFAGGQGIYDQYKQRATTVALFTNDTWHVTDAFDITAGLRYTSEEKTLNTFQTTSDGGIGCRTALGRAGAIAGIVGAANVGTVIGNLCLPWANPAFNGRGTTQNRSDKEWSGTIKASYRISPEVFTYASFARGYKGGGYNLDRTQSSDGTQAGTAVALPIVPIYDTSFPAEFVDSYEIGMKNTLFNRTVLLNFTGFYQKYTDFQLNTFLGTSFVVRSIPEVTSTGVDADFIWFTPVHGLSVQSGLTYADTKYGKQKIPNDPGNALVLLPGSRLSLAPKYSASGSLTYERPVGGDMKARFNVGAKYSSSYNTASDLLPPKMQKAFTVVNARVGIGAADDKWTVELWGQNLLDQEYKQVAFNGTLQGSSGLTAANPVYDPAKDTITYDAFLGAPRTYGVTLRSRF